MRRLFALMVSELLPHRRIVLRLLALTAAGALFDIVAPTLLGRGIDAAVVRGQSWVIVALLSGWCAARIASEYLRRIVSRDGGLLGSTVAERYTHRRVMELIDKPLGHHHGAKQREGASALMKFHWQFENFLSGAVIDIVVSTVSLFGILGYIAFLDLGIGALLLGTGIMYAALTWYVKPRQMALSRALHKAIASITDLQWDAVQNVQVVKSCASEGQVDAGVAAKRGDYLAAEAAAQQESFLLGGRQTLTTVVGTGAAVLVAALALREGRFTPGQVSALVAYSFSVIGFFRFFGQNARTALLASSTLAELEAFMDAQPEDFTSGTATTIVGDVEFRDVRFRYRDEKAVLERISFRSPAGTRTAIVGRSGEGKTTMVDLLYRFYAPSGGEILYDGMPAKEINLRSLRSQMAYVPQETTLFHETLEYNVRFGKPNATEGELRAAIRFAQLDSFVEGLPEGLTTIVGEKGLKLSGGQRQRVSLARAFLRDPKILVLDEPTSHQDAETEQGIQAALAELMRGRTTFVIAHRLRTVMDADLILVLDGGRIVERGTHAELAAKKDGVYQKLFKAQGMMTDGTMPSGVDPRTLN